MTWKTAPACLIALTMFASSPLSQAQEDTREQSQRSDQRGDRPPGPDLSNAAEQLGISEQDLHAALRASGGPPPDLSKAAEALGISEEDLKAAMPPPPNRGRRP